MFCKIQNKMRTELRRKKFIHAVNKRKLMKQLLPACFEVLTSAELTN